MTCRLVLSLFVLFSLSACVVEPLGGDRGGRDHDHEDHDDDHRGRD